MRAVDFGVHRSGRVVYEADEPGSAAGFLKVPQLRQLLADREEVEVLVAFGNALHRLPDPAMAQQEEIVLLQEGGDAEPRARVAEDGAQHRLFSLGAEGRAAFPDVRKVEDRS